MRFKRVLVFFLILVGLGLLAYYYPADGIDFRAIDQDEYSFEQVFVERVIDGDTIETNIGKIRLLGVNTPERNQVFYDEAKLFLMEIENKSVFLLRDSEDLDKYGRLLRYVYYDDRILNVELLENGFATSFMTDGLSLKNKLLRAEEFAKSNEINLWSNSPDVCADCVELIELNFNEEFFILQNICDFDCDLSGWFVKDDANHFFKLNNLKASEIERYDSEQKVWNNLGDRFFMRDSDGKLVIFYGY